jgi:hypothetical protein
MRNSETKNNPNEEIRERERERERERDASTGEMLENRLESGIKP